MSDQLVHSDLVETILRELITIYRVQISPARLRPHVQEAVTDLRGSINAESIPEMACRLVLARLEGNAAIDAAGRKAPQLSPAVSV